ncbi:2-amino-4-hydroxy-6-hydroxymethyldihydropteridine diphosphokinase [Thermomonas sp.]|jgi:2-amino-4-hydroxy-6-hydroxymethyldihydropteridine diphosphokinase|uniref:2-amino-4-hydroxy-6- hydroxymethyldihydropteridine diphosphokinase n=1 Tax=Thermomonas sp. TaxID=1971895 RepID=UPI00257A9DD2|nr:2-amino-4-hydroxy-6-hydroxymethyldihydropteridine diphosphokinase [Thermomonas sp.]
MPVRACIGLGGNLGDPALALRAAFRALAALPESRLLATSRLYRTPAWGRTDQPDYVNAAALLETRLAPQALLAQLLAIERAAGRLRDGEAAATRWGPRVLDLDLLLYGQQRIDVPGLRVPHPHLHERAFALVPLAEIAADQPFPGHGSVGEALRHVDSAGVDAIEGA